MGLFGMLFGTVTSWLVLPDLRPAYHKMSFVHKLMFLVVHLSDRLWKWYNAPVVLGLVYLELRRTLHQKYNLIAVGNSKQELPYQVPAPLRAETIKLFTASGGAKDDEQSALLHNDQPDHGFFGRNAEPQHQKSQLLDPHPSLVAVKLLNRRKLQDYGKQFNMLAASWINFMIHDWIDHQENLDEEVEITAPSSVAAQCPLKSFKVYPTKEIPARNMIGHLNTRTPWWDGSVIYGSNKEAQRRVRTFQGGKLKIRPDGWLENDDNDLAVSGDVRNLWVGVATLQSLFIAEHNAVCVAIKKAYPSFSDEELFQRARLVTAAVMAKIHTIDWTPQLLKNNILGTAMRTNWYGLLGKRFKDTFGATPFSLLSGLVGMKKPVDHGVPYSLTEEFTSVYRLHPLLPDKIDIKNINSTGGSQLHTPPTVEEIEIPELLGDKGNEKGLELGVKTLLTSLGHQSAGALTLFNYPTWLRQVTPENEDGTARVERVDMACLDIYRDRERSVSRYNQLRRSLFMPTITQWEDLTHDQETLALLRELYGSNVELLDLLVGLLLEKKIPGFAISETAFFIFLLMATRRLEADPFFTSHFNEKYYTREGLKWVNTTEGLKDVLRRHYPKLVGDWMTATSAFSVWNQSPEVPQLIPAYLRWGAASPAATS